MKTYVICTILWLSAITAFGQKLSLEKASPFTAIRWQNEQPIVQFNNEWYQLEKIDHLSKAELLAFCQKQFGSKWQKRFTEDLVEVLQGLGYQPNVKVALQLVKDGALKTYTGTFTAENRNSSVLYNRTMAAGSTNQTLQKIPLSAAIADLKQFEEVLKSVSSYSQLSGFDYPLAIQQLANTLIKANQEVDINEFSYEIAKIMAEIGDRHSAIKNEAFYQSNNPKASLKLPFGLAVIKGKIVALQKEATSQQYHYYEPAYPLLKSINGIAVETLIDTYHYRDKKAPAAAKLSRGTAALEKYGALLLENNRSTPDQLKVVFTNGKTEKTALLTLSTTTHRYVAQLAQAQQANGDKMRKSNWKELNRTIAPGIAYLPLPEMFHYDEVEGLEDFIKGAFKSFAHTKALIIDLRNNPGGGRELLQTFAGYLVQAKQSPWVANVAYLRTENQLNGPEESMSARYLYPYQAAQLSAADRKAIDQFNQGFKPQKTIDHSKFSAPFYMVLHQGKESYTQPVYILVNEESFSAASVFASAFKGLPNVKIVGQTTDGSSGNSKTVYLKHSNLKMNVSTMLSFQRNGTTLDGNGTEPDILIQADEKQVLQGYDSQLNELIKHIQKQ